MVIDDIEIKYKRGKMVKPESEMTPEELKIWKEKCENEMRKNLFSIGQPLVYFIDGKPVMEFKDGTTEPIL